MTFISCAVDLNQHFNTWPNRYLQFIESLDSRGFGALGIEVRGKRPGVTAYIMDSS